MFPAMAGRFFTPSTTWEAPTIVSSQTKLNLSFHKTLVLPFPQFWSCGLKSSFIVLEFKKELSSVKDTISIQTVTEMPPFSVSVSQYFFSLPLKFTALVSNRSFHKSLAGVILCIKSCLYVCSVAQSCQLFCDPMDCSPTDSYVHRISQARILGQIVISSSRGSFDLETKSESLASPALPGRFFTNLSTWEAPKSCLENSFYVLITKVSSHGQTVILSHFLCIHFPVKTKSSTFQLLRSPCIHL